jgi:hypothetical protein
LCPQGFFKMFDCHVDVSEASHAAQHISILHTRR